jgi:hypothetical protein
MNRDCTVLTVLADDRGTDAELERHLAQANDPRLIPGIYNYCQSRCERCPFTDRCLTFRHMGDDDVSDPGRHVLEQTGQTFARAVDVLKNWCRQEGVDFERLREEARSEAANSPEEQRSQTPGSPMRQLRWGGEGMQCRSNADGVAPRAAGSISPWLNGPGRRRALPQRSRCAH